MITSNSPTEVRVTRRQRLLTEKYSTALGGIQALGQYQSAEVERAAELVSLVELAWVNGRSDHTPEEETAFMRLGEAAAEAVEKLGLPAIDIDIDLAVSFSAAVDGLLSKSAGPLGVTLF